MFCRLFLRKMNIAALIAHLTELNAAAEFTRIDVPLFLRSCKNFKNSLQIKLNSTHIYLKQVKHQIKDLWRIFLRLLFLESAKRAVLLLFFTYFVFFTLSTSPAVDATDLFFLAFFSFFFPVWVSFFVDFISAL